MDNDDDAFFNLGHVSDNESFFANLPDTTSKVKKKKKKAKKNKSVGVKLEHQVVEVVDSGLQASKKQRPEQASRFKSSLVSDFEKLEKETLEKSLAEDEEEDPDLQSVSEHVSTPPVASTSAALRPASDSIDESFGDIGRIEEKLSKSMQERVSNVAVIEVLDGSEHSSAKSGSVDAQTSVNEDGEPPVSQISSKYVFKIVSRLPGTEDIVIDRIVMKGNKRFREILVAAIKHLASNNFIEPQDRIFYHPDAAILMYKGKIKIQHYMKPSFLDLPKPKFENEEIFVNLTLETKENADKQLLEGYQSVMTNESKPEESSDTDDDIIYQDADSVNKAVYHAANKDKEEEAGVITIKLKDKDGASFEFKVKQSTLIKNIVGYYVRNKPLPSDKGVKLLFDADTLRPEMTVEDAELEDEDVLDVVY